MGHRAYRSARRSLLFLATLTVTLATASMTVLCPGQLATAARHALTDEVGVRLTQEILSDILHASGVDPTRAPRAAESIATDPGLRRALDETAASGDAAGLPVAIQGAVAPHSDLAAADLAGRLTGLAASAQGTHSETVLAGPETGHPGAVVGPRLDGTTPFPAAGPRVLGGTHPMSWVLESTDTLVPVGAGVSAVGMAALVALVRTRRAQTLRATGWWALIVGGLPLALVHSGGALARAGDLPAPVQLAAVVAPVLAAPAAILWWALFTGGVLLVGAARFTGMLPRIGAQADRSALPVDSGDRRAMTVVGGNASQ